MIEFFTTFFYLPIYNALIWLYSICISDLGIAIIALTIIIKFALLPLSKKQIASQKDMQLIQPEIKKLQAKHKDDRQKLAQETMALYKEHNINIGAGCLPLIFQIVVFFTMYRVVINITDRDNFIVITDELYSFIPVVTNLNELSLGFLDLRTPFIPIAIVTAFAQWYQIRMMQGKQSKNETATKEVAKKDEAPTQPDFATIMQKQMLYMIPAMTLFIGVTFPAGLTLYWLVSTLFTIAQQWSVMHSTPQASKES